MSLGPGGDDEASTSLPLNMDTIRRRYNAVKKTLNLVANQENSRPSGEQRLSSGAPRPEAPCVTEDKSPEELIDELLVYSNLVTLSRATVADELGQVRKYNEELEMLLKGSQEREKSTLALLNEYRTSLEALGQQLGAVRESAQALQAQAEEKLRDAKAMLAQETSQNSVNRTNLLVLQSKISALEAELAKYQQIEKTPVHDEAELQELRLQALRHSNRTAELEQENAKLKAEITSQRLHSAGDCQECQGLRSKHAEKADECAALKKEVERLSGECRELQGYLQEIFARL